MPALLGNIIVVLVLLGLCFLAGRSIWRSHRDGGHCNGDCSRCGGCGGGNPRKPHR